MGAQVLGGRESVKVAVVQTPSAFMDKKRCLENASQKNKEAAKEHAQ